MKQSSQYQLIMTIFSYVCMHVPMHSKLMKNLLCILGYHQKCHKVTNLLNWFVSIQFSNLLALLLTLIYC